MNNMVKKTKIRHVIALLVVMFGFGIYVAFNPVMQSLNILTQTTLVSEPLFSSNSGFYNQAFYLELTAAPDTKIYYTLDCTDPDETSTLYTNPILIDNISKKENVYSKLTNVSAGFYSDLIEKYQTKDSDPKYVAPDFPVEKCVVIRAMAVDKDGNRSKIKTNSYFVGQDFSFYNGCNIVSLVTPPDNLFDDSIGIYVTGDVFDKYMLNRIPEPHWRFWEANYRQKGSEWERPVDFAFFNTDKELLLSANGGIRVQGGVSRGTLPRNLNLYANEKYSQSSVMNDRLFYPGFTPTKVTFSAGGNRTISLFNDYMMTNKTSNLNFSKMVHLPYMLFLDGEFWGFYWLTNAYDGRYISYHYGVEEQDVVMVKNGALEVGNDSDILLYDNMKNFISENDMSLAENYARACELIDIDSCIDYYACMAYIARNEDWPMSNFALWRSKNVADNEYSDGKWRWMLFDCNSSSMMKSLISHDTLNYIIRHDKIFASLWDNKDFRAEFEKRIFKIADSCFNAQEMSDFIDDYAQKMIPILEKSWARFYGSKNDKQSEFYKWMEEHRAFFNNRRKVVQSWFE